MQLAPPAADDAKENAKENANVTTTVGTNPGPPVNTDPNVNPNGYKVQTGSHENFFSSIMPFSELDPQHAALAGGGSFTSNAWSANSTQFWSASYTDNLSIDCTKGSTMPIKLFLNPLDPTTSPGGISTSNQAVTGFAVNGTALPQANTSGPFVTLEGNFPDGTSQTVLITERYSGANGTSSYGVNAWYGGMSYSESNWGNAASWGTAITSNIGGSCFGREAYLQFAPIAGNIPTTQQGPPLGNNTFGPANAGHNINNTGGAVQAGRASGLLMGMADGSVQTLTSGSAEKFFNVWPQLITPADGLAMPDW